MRLNRPLDAEATVDDVDTATRRVSVAAVIAFAIGFSTVGMGADFVPRALSQGLELVDRNSPSDNSDDDSRARSDGDGSDDAGRAKTPEYEVRLISAQPGIFSISAKQLNTKFHDNLYPGDKVPQLIDVTNDGDLDVNQVRLSSEAVDLRGRTAWLTHDVYVCSTPWRTHERWEMPGCEGVQSRVVTDLPPSVKSQPILDQRVGPGKVAHFLILTKVTDDHTLVPTGRKTMINYSFQAAE